MASLSQCQSIDLAADDSDRSQAGEQIEQAMLRSSLECLPLDALVQEAQQESSRFRRQQPTSGRASFEVFRRALLLREDAAWAGLYQLYTPLIKAWLLARHPGVCVQAEELDGLVNETFAKFARALGAKKWSRFAGTHQLLAYLKCCAHSVAAEAWRQRQQRAAREASLEALAQEQSPLREGPDADEVVIERLLWRDFWQAAAGVAACEQERLILEQHYGRGVPLRELAPRYPEQFPTIQSVYRSKRNLLHRLRRSQSVLQAAGLTYVGGSREAGRPTKRPTPRPEPSQKGETIP